MDSPGKFASHHSSNPDTPLPEKPYVANRNSKQQLKALMRKNFIMKSRGALCCCTGTEIVLPLLFFLVMIAPKKLIDNSTYNDEFFDPYYLATSRNAVRDPGHEIYYSPNNTVTREVTLDAVRHLFCDSGDSHFSEGTFMSSILANTNMWSGPEGGELPTLLGERLNTCFVPADNFNFLGPIFADLSAAFEGGEEGGQPTPGESAVDAAAGSPAEGEADEGEADEEKGPMRTILIPLNTTIQGICAPTACGDPGFLENRAQCECFFAAFAHGFATEEEAVSTALMKGNQNSVFGTVHFENVTGDDLRYKLRVNGTRFRNHEQYESFTRKFVQRWDAEVTNDYWEQFARFSTVRNALDQALITHKWSPTQPVRIDARVKSFPWQHYEENIGGVIASAFFSILLVFAFTTTTTIVLKTIVAEKELRLREGMAMMGMGDRVYWGSWFLTHFSTMSLTMLMCTIIGMYPFEFTNPIIQLIFLLAWGASLISFCYFLACFFDRSLIASIVGSMVYVCGLAPAITVAIMQPYGGSGWGFMCLLPAGSIYTWGRVLQVWENGHEGVDGDTFNLSIHNKQHFSAASVLGLTIFDIFFYAILTWYFDKVWPSKYTAKEKPWFLFTSAYWRGAPAPAAPAESEDMEAAEMTSRANIQPLNPAQEASAAVKVRGLCKTFGEVRAVNELSLSFANNQISTLLGHNGAGKTTTISMLTGGLAPTKGEALIDGKDVGSEMAEIRKSLGVCPQFDILWPIMTVHEHMKLYAAFAGIPAEYIEAEIATMIAEVGLAEKMHEPVSSLSGGQKRKLSLSIAFLGNPKVVFLDEPTSGMDPYSRRMSWEVIRKHRAGRAVVLTTHFMDEADLLSDRVAIMSGGSLAAIGSSTFLKNRYGLGYLLTLEKKSESTPGEPVDRLIKAHVQSAVQATHVGTELSYKLPHEESARFADMLEELDEQKAALGVLSYGLSNTTLEEVFLSIAEGAGGVAAAEKSKKQMDAAHRRLDSLNSQRAEKAKPFVTGMTLKVHQFRALMMKRVINFRRDKMGILVQLVAPVLFVIIAMLIGKANFEGETGDYPAVVVDRSLVNDGDFPYGAADGALDLGPYTPPALTSKMLRTNRTLRADLRCFCPTKDQADGVPADQLCQPVEVEEEWKIAPVCEPFFPSTFEEYLLQGQEYRTPCNNEPGACDSLFVNAFDVSTKRFDHVLMGNPTSFFSLTTAMDAANNLVLRAVSGGAGTITVTNQPIPDPPGEEDETPDFVQDLIVSIFFGLGMSILSASFSSFLVAEKMNNAKHLQMVSGVDKVSFWVAAFVADFVTYLVPALSLVIVIAAFNESNYVDNGALGGIFLLLLLFGWASIPLSYLLHFPFRMPMNSLVVQMAIYTVLTLGSTISAVVFDQLDTESAKDIDRVLKWVFRLIPHYAFTRGVYDLSQNNREKGLLDEFPEFADRFDDRGMFHLKVTGYHLIFLFLEGVVFFGLVLFIELNEKVLLTKGVAAPHDADEDEDVAAERTHVAHLAQSGEAADQVVVVNGLAKTYRNNHAAVKPLSFAVGRGQCFGLLGINGAGKTSTFRMLTGEYAPSAGDATVQGRPDATGRTPMHSIVEELDEARRLIGYCPQFDGIQPNMTAREHLRFYATIRGVPHEDIEEMVTALLERMDLTRYADRQAGSYSGGNKRKLSVGIALVGDPPVVLLDEPSTGMDPEARRFMWDVISTTMTNRCVVLTSHSMEECEALCNRIGIMVSGQFRVLGTLQHIKNRFSEGYSLDFNVKPENLAAVQAYIQRTIPGAALLQSDFSHLKYRVGSETRLPNLLRAVEAMSKKSASHQDNLASEAGGLEDTRLVEDYSVTQTTLEQVFIRFAHQYDNTQPNSRPSVEVATRTTVY